MRIDAHQHFWEYSEENYSWISPAMPQLKRDFLPPDLSPLLAAHSIEGCVAVQARQTEQETDFLLSLAEQHPFIKAVVGWVDLQSADIDQQLAAFTEKPLLKGMRHIVQDEPDERFLLNASFLRGIQALKTYGYTYDLLIYEKHLPVAVTFLEKIGEMPIVLDHIGKPQISASPSKNWKEGIKNIASFPHVHCKISGLVTEANWQKWQDEDFKPYLEWIFDNFGIDRLLFGSDWPVCLLAAPNYTKVVNLVENFMAGCSAEEKARVFGENAGRFYLGL